jgi:signal transduction histidine kinase
MPYALPAGWQYPLETVARRKMHQIIVSDDGVASPEQLAHLFERFYQVNPTGKP